MRNEKLQMERGKSVFCRELLDNQVIVDWWLRSNAGWYMFEHLVYKIRLPVESGDVESV